MYISGELIYQLDKNVTSSDNSGICTTFDQKAKNSIAAVCKTTGGMNIYIVFKQLFLTHD